MRRTSWYGVVVGGLLAACSRGPAPLQIYTSLDVNEARDLITAYEQRSGDRVNFVRLSSGEALTRLRAERSNPQAALWLGGSASEHAVAEVEGLSAPYQPAAEFEIRPEYRGAKWGWSGWHLGIVGFATNTEFLRANHLAPPQSYADLLKPEFKGKVGLAYAYTSGTSFTILASMVELMGEAQAFAFIKQLDGQVHHYNNSGAACVTQAGLGEIGVCLAFSQDILSKGVDKGYPITLTYPQDGAGYEVGAVSLVQGAPEAERARRLIDWLFTKEAQGMVAARYKVPLHPEVALRQEAASGRAVKLVAVDVNRSVTAHDHLLARWREVTGK